MLSVGNYFTTGDAEKAPPGALMNAISVPMLMLGVTAVGLYYASKREARIRGGKKSGKRSGSKKRKGRPTSLRGLR